MIFFCMNQQVHYAYKVLVNCWAFIFLDHNCEDHVRILKNPNHFQDLQSIVHSSRIGNTEHVADSLIVKVNIVTDNMYSCQ